MQISHVLSDLVLCIISFFVFFNYLVKIHLSESILWESFVLSIGVAALLGCFRFAGFDNATNPSRFFHNIASFVGAAGLVVAVYVTVFEVYLKRITMYIVLTVGFVLFALADIFKLYAVYKWVPIMAILLVLAFGILAFLKGKMNLGFWITAGVLFFCLATFRANFFAPGEYLIDVYHYLVAAGLLCLGRAAGLKREKIALI